MKIYLSMIQLNNFTPLAENEYDQNILRDENERGFFLTQTYFRDSNKNFYIPAFNLQKESDDSGGVCANKYIHEIKKLTGEKISMAFIVHPDKTRGKNFLGKYVTYNATVEPQLKTLFKEIPGDKQQIGSFYLLPYDGITLNQSEINLSLFFKMMFEYFLGCWTKCWECGSDLVDITPLLTNGGYEKYYMHCEKCGAFWVKTHCHYCHNHLVKHYINYHVENKGNWLVLCPKCGS